MVLGDFGVTCKLDTEEATSPLPHSVQLNMEFPPASWDVFPAADFETTGPRDPGELGVELMVQARANGRLLDHFRITVGGTSLITTKFNLASVMSHKEVPDWNVVIAAWPRDINIRRNMATGPWMDLKDLISSNDARIESPEGVAVDSKLFLDYSDSIADKMANSASIRWSVCVGEDNRPCLALMALPAPSSTFSGKPLFKGYVNRSIIPYFSYIVQTDILTN